MHRSLFIFNFNRPLRAIIRIISFFIFLEGFLCLGGSTYIWFQEYHNQSHAVKNGYRILCLGDSITASGGEYSYPNQLQYVLNHSGADIKYQVFNKGLPSWKTSELAGYFPEFLNKYQPNMVIFMIGANDNAYFKAIPVNQQLTLKFLIFDRIKVFKLLKRLIEEAAGPKIEMEEYKEPMDPVLFQFLDTDAVAKERSVGVDANQAPARGKEIALPPYFQEFNKYHPLTAHHYNGMIELALSRGMKVVVMQYPMVRLAPLKDMVYSTNHVSFVDNEKVFKEAVERRGLNSCFGDEWGHLTPQGAALLVDNLYKKVWGGGS